MIRLATMADYPYISHALARKAIPYMKPSHAKGDIINGRMYVKVINDKVVAQCSLVEEPNYHYTALKRMLIYRKENYGKHIANEFIQFFSTFNIPLGQHHGAKILKSSISLKRRAFAINTLF